MNLFKKVQQRLGKMTLAVKLTASFALSVAVVFVLLVTLTVGRSISVIKNTFTQSNHQILRMTLNDLDAYSDNMLTYSLSIRNDESFMQYLSSPATFDYDAEVYTKSLIRNIFYSRDDINRYTVYMLPLNRAYAISKDSPNVRSFDAPTPALIPGYEEAAREAPYLHTAPRQIDGIYTITRIIINVADGKPLAVVLLEVDGSYIKTLTQNSMFKAGEIFLLSGNNRLYYSSDPDMINPESLVHLSPDLVMALGGESPIVEAQGTPYIMVADASERYGWRFVHLLPQATIDAETASLSRELLLISIPLLALCLFFVFMIARYLTMPLYVLSGKVSGSKVPLPPTLCGIGGSAEIHMLSDRFDELTTRVSHLEKQNTQALQERDSALLSVLQARVTPGIISYTLGAFSALSTRRGHNRLTQMTEGMQDLLRYTANPDDYERVEDEVLFTNGYLQLVKSQAFERFDYRVSADDQCREQMIPKLCIYPLAEYALLRTQSVLRDDTFISIHVRLQGSLIVIVASDNAEPPSATALDELRRKLDAPSGGIVSGSGLVNLAARLHLMYRDEATIAIDTKKTGTTITVCIPLDEEQ